MDNEANESNAYVTSPVKKVTCARLLMHKHTMQEAWDDHLAPMSYESDEEPTMYSEAVPGRVEMVQAETDCYEEKKIIGSGHQAMCVDSNRQVSDVISQFEADLELVDTNEQEFV